MWILILIALVLFLLLLPVNIIARWDEEMEFFIKIWFFKINPKSKGSKNGKKKKKKSSGLAGKIIHQGEDIKEFAKYVSQRCIKISELNLKIDFGTNDAACTGMITGALNTVCYTVMSTVHHLTLVKRWSIQINPDFEKELFDIDFVCIATTKLWHIIGMGMKGYKLYKILK